MTFAPAGTPSHTDDKMLKRIFRDHYSHKLSDCPVKKTLLNEIKKRFDNIQKVHLFSMATVLDPRFKKIHLDDGTALARTITSIKRYLNENSDLGAVPVLSQASDEGDPEDIWQAHRQKLMTENSCRSEGAGTSELDVYTGPD